MDTTDIAANEAIERALATHPLPGEEGSVLVGHLTISEWMDPGGARYLRFTTDDDAPYWTIFGYLHDAGLYYDQERIGNNEESDD